MTHPLLRVVLEGGRCLFLVREDAQNWVLNEFTSPKSKWNRFETATSPVTGHRKTGNL